jgi:hypothetical protein
VRDLHALTKTFPLHGSKGLTPPLVADSPGEYYIDRASLVLYLYPPSGGAPSPSDSLVLTQPSVPSILNLTDVQHLAFANLTLRVRHLVSGFVYQSLVSRLVSEISVGQSSRTHKLTNVQHLAFANLTLTVRARLLGGPGGGLTGTFIVMIMKVVMV